MTRARVIALGQVAAGDDGVGFAVLDELRRRDGARDLELLAVPDATALIELLATDLPVILVDAVVARPGCILALDEKALAHQKAVSSHGVGVVEAIGIARALHAQAICPRLRIVAIGIADAIRHGTQLSAEVAAAVPMAADRVFALTRAPF